MVLLSITPLLDGVLRRDIIAPFHTSGPPLLQFHLAIEQWGYTNTKTKIILPISIEKLYVFFASHRSGDMIPDQVSVYVDDGIASLKTVAETGTDYYLIIGG